jgi:hypothetical protein
VKKPNCEKKPIKILKNRPVRFQFYKPEIEKNEPNRTQTGKNKPNRKKNRGKSEKTEPKHFKPVFVLKNRNESSQNRLV